MKKQILIIASLLTVIIALPAALFAQGSYQMATTVPVTMYGTIAKNPWVGGLNAPLFSEIDLNGDGIKDLFVFEKDGNRMYTYINNGTANTVDYVYAPQYAKKFPQMHDWVLLKDYNCDGKEDIFTYSYSGGMTVYRNDYTLQSGLKFNIVYPLVYSKYGPITANLYVSSVNLPALTDVDYDGDLDVLTFPVSGNFVEYHENLGMDLYNKCDTLVFQLNQSCFGNFGLSGYTNTAILNAGCRVANNPNPINIEQAVLNTMHSGSCMLALDIDGDYDKDLLNGDILGQNLLLIANGGDSTLANMAAQDTTFPSYDTPVNLITFPSPYYLDVNNDGAKDLVVAPCISASAENYNNVLYYKNTTNNSTNVFNYQQNRFLSEDMIEVGSGANVTLFDIDGDGLKDMIVGNYGYFTPTPPYESGLAYFRNTGSASNPAFELQTIDFNNFFSLPNTGIDPAFGDLDNDGDADLILGNTDGNLIYYTNTAGPGNFPVYVLTQPSLSDNNGTLIDVGQFSSPQIVDVNKDGKNDLLIGEKSGNINYYENTGTSSNPVFTLATTNLGGVLVNNSMNIYGYSSPVLYDSAGVSQLLVGSVSGYIYQYNNIDGNLNGTFNLVDSMYYGIFEPERISIDIADLNGDGKLEILTGNNAGGVTLYNYQTSSGIPVIAGNTTNFKLYPNPVSDQLFIKFDSELPTERRITLIDMLGRVVDEQISTNNVVIFSTPKLAQGVYNCRVIEGKSVLTSKFIVKK